MELHKNSDNHNTALPYQAGNPAIGSTGKKYRCKGFGRSRSTGSTQTEYISALVHEARNPLTNINLAIELLKKMPVNYEQQICLDIIMRASGRINNLVTDLLTSYQAGIKTVELFSIHQLLDDVLVIAEDRIRLKNVTVIKGYTDHDFSLVLNRPNMKIALTNIIINAIEAMEARNGKLNVTTRFNEGRFAIHIEDNGCGISEENLAKIFQPYFTNKPGGLGIGLATTYAILRANHVRVNVISSKGHGTIFNLLFARKDGARH